MKHLLFALFALCLSGPLRGESQDNSNDRAVTDPFSNPGTYEFTEDEKADKEFFHLGRFLMIGLDIGGNIYTGGLGGSLTPGVTVGGKLLYFFDRSIAFEAAGHYAVQDDVINHPVA